MKKYLIIIIFLFSIINISCEKEPQILEKPGCTNTRAINYDYSANVDNGTCEYSNVVFYSKYDMYNINGYIYQINNVEVSVNGNFIGNVTSYYPNGVSSCYATGCVTYQMITDKKIYWESTINLINHTPIYNSGSLTPYSSDCLRVSVVND